MKLRDRLSYNVLVLALSMVLYIITSSSPILPQTDANDAVQAKKENILDLNQHLNSEILVKFHGGREVKGTLKGFDALLNLVLDDAVEFLRGTFLRAFNTITIDQFANICSSDPEDPYKEKADGETRNLGLLVCRGSAVMCLYPTLGVEEIQNPFSVPE